MAASAEHIFAQIRRWTSSHLADSTDAVLLERFVQQRDEAAFTALVAQHGAMVLRSCRRVLGDVQEAEDAFQATFLILARKAHRLRRPEALPGWLHSVARRVALKARGKSSAVLFSQTPLPETLSDLRTDPLAQLTARELLTVLDEEVQRLPSAQRSAVVLCCLEGHTQEEAAHILGWTAGSLKGHLERGRKRLQGRITRRGIALPAALAIVAVSRGEAASALLQRSAVRAALGGAGGSPMAAALAEGVLKGTFAGKLAGVTALVLTMAFSASVIALVYRTPATESPGNKTPTAPIASKKADASKPEVRVDALGDPLPAGAIARLGTVRFRHGDSISFIAFTPDGRRLVSRGPDGVRVWEAATGKELWHLATSPERARGSIDLSPDGKRVAVAAHGLEGAIQFWDVKSGKNIGSLGAKLRPLVRFTPDGKLLATSSTPEDIELWDAASRKKLRSWKAHEMPVCSIAFSADSRKMLTSDTWGKVRLWDVATNRQLQEFTPLSWNPTRADIPATTSLAPDGALLAILEQNEKHVSTAGAVGWRARVSLWDTATGKLRRQLVCPSRAITEGHAPPFFALTFTLDGKRIVTSGPDQFLRVWDPATGKELRRLPFEEGLPTLLAFSKDGNTLAAALDASIRLVDMSSGKINTPPGGPLVGPQLALLTPDGRTAITSAPLDPLFVWDVAAGRVRRRLKGHDGAVPALQLARDGRTLYSYGQDKSLRVWNLATGEERRRIEIGHDLGVWYRGFVVTPDGTTVALIDSSRETIRLLDAGTGEERHHFHLEDLFGMALTADGRSLVGWSTTGQLRVWDVAAGRKQRDYPLPPIKGSVGWYYSVALSPDGRLLAIGSQHLLGSELPKEHFLVLKDLASGQDVYRLDKLLSGVDMLAFSPDGRMLAWGGFKDPVIRLLEVASGRERRRLMGHRGAVTSLAFSANGERLISGSNDTTALVWDIGSRFNPRRAPAALTVAELEALWADLAWEDAARAYRAIHQLAAAPESSVPFLRKRLQPVASVDKKRLARLIADLDSEDFAVRQKASAALRELSDQPLAAYRKALEGKPSLETRRRLEELLEKAASDWWDVSGERLRSLRGVEALELAGTKEAREALAVLAAGAPEARLTEQAKAALERLK